MENNSNRTLDIMRRALEKAGVPFLINDPNELRFQLKSGIGRIWSEVQDYRNGDGVKANDLGDKAIRTYLFGLNLGML